MAITTFTELKTALASWAPWMANETTTVPDFITLFEACANRRLRVRQMELLATLTVASGEATLPTDYLSWRRVTWTGSPRTELEYVQPSYLQAAFPDGSSGTPAVFTIEGSTLKVRPISSTSLDFLYYQKIPSLSTGAPTNWLLTAHPDLYLFGSLVEGQMFNVNTELAALWKGRRDELFDEIALLSNRTRGVGGIRVMGPTP